MKLSEYTGAVKGAAYTVLGETHYFSDGEAFDNGKLISGRVAPGDPSSCSLEFYMRLDASNYVRVFHFDNDFAHFDGDLSAPVIKSPVFFMESAQGIKDSEENTVLTSQQPAIPDCDATTLVDTVNSILAMLRTHGLIAM